jgi:RNA polymerase sigma-70 factor (ECF subfamily)
MPPRRPIREDPSRLADEDLLARVEEGDDGAFAALYDRHARVAYSLAYRLLGSREAAEDLVQDTFMAVWRAPSTYSAGRGSVRTWLLAILHNRGVDRLRSSAAMSRRQEALEHQAIAGRSQSEDVAAAAAARVEAGELRGALRDLPAEQRQVLGLAYYGGFTHQEISGMLELPLGTVKSRMHLGLSRIRRTLGDPGMARS